MTVKQIITKLHFAYFLLSAMLDSRKNTELHICTTLFNPQAVIFQEYFLNLWRFDNK